MKKFILIFLLVLLMAFSFSCKRQSQNDPTWSGPSGFNLVVKGTANPSVLLVDGNTHTSEITVRANDYLGNPIVNNQVYLVQYAGVQDQDGNIIDYKRVDYGEFENHLSTITLITGSDGICRTTYYGPTNYFDQQMYIRATLVVGGKNNYWSLPSDTIPISLISDRTNYRISGQVKLIDGTGLTQVMMLLAGTSAAYKTEVGGTDAWGYYQFWVPEGWRGTVTPSRKGYTFTPTSRQYLSVVGDQNGQDFIATLGTPSAPTVTLLNPAQTGATCDIYVNTNDVIIITAQVVSSSAIAQVRCFINGSSTQTPFVYTTSQTIYTWSWTVPIGTSFDSYTISIVATDTSGLSGTGQAYACHN